MCISRTKRGNNPWQATFKIRLFTFYDDDDDGGGDDDMHLTPSSYSSTLHMPPHIVTVNAAAAAHSTACFCCYISKHFFCYNPLFTTLFFCFLYMSTNTDPSHVHNGFFEILFLKVSNAIYILERGGAVQLFETRRHKTGGFGFDSL